MATKVEFQHNKERAIEVNGVVYVVAKRTGELEKKIVNEYDSVLTELTEYERYKTLITLLLGKKAFSELCPDGEKESLDLMAQIAYYAQREFSADITELEKQKLTEQINSSGVNEITGTLGKLNTEFEKTIKKADLANKKRK